MCADHDYLCYLVHVKELVTVIRYFLICHRYLGTMGGIVGIFSLVVKDLACLPRLSGCSQRGHAPASRYVQHAARLDHWLLCCHLMASLSCGSDGQDPSNLSGVPSPCGGRPRSYIVEMWEMLEMWPLPQWSEYPLAQYIDDLGLYPAR